MLCGYKKYTCTGAGGLWYNQFERTVQSFGRTVYIYETFGAGNTERYLCEENNFLILMK